MAGIEILNKWNIKYATISVISEEHMINMEEYFRFMSSLGVKYIALMMPEIEGLNKESFLSSYSNDDIIEFWRSVITLAVKYGIRVRELDTCIVRFAMPLTQHGTTIPHWFLNVAYNGQYSSFDPELMGQTMSDGAEFYLGNLDGDLSMNWKRFESSKMYSDIVNGVRKCKSSCEYFSVCGGGPVGNKLYENGTFDSTETLACRYRIKCVVDMLLQLSETNSEIIDQYIDMLEAVFLRPRADPIAIERAP
jgi:uncharacterized protein